MSRPSQPRTARLACFVSVVFAVTWALTGQWLAAGTVAAVAAGLELSDEEI